ncbi:MAG: hypothetical protein GY874_07400 [Desulfobacteraceae bacterium]|nr:hypothetical protein [Desulfobacteraceae bacterium]
MGKHAFFVSRIGGPYSGLQIRYYSEYAASAMTGLDARPLAKQISSGEQSNSLPEAFK